VTVPQKLEIVLAGLRGDRSVAEACREHQISENLDSTADVDIRRSWSTEPDARPLNARA
jgi:hypothetical protein